MPKGCPGKPKSKEHNLKNKEAILKLYKSGKSKMGFKKGKENIAKNKDIRTKISKALTGKIRTKEWKENNRLANIGKHCGKLNPMWKGGLSFRGYDKTFSLQLKRVIKSRDNHVCQLCYNVNNDKELLVHHIDYNKKNNAAGNLISLCKSCHGKTNHNRNFWTLNFRTLIICNSLNH